MKFLRDVHIPLAAIRALKNKNIDIVRSFELGLEQDADDEALLTLATEKNRILITCDAGFEARCYLWQAKGKKHASILYFDMTKGDCQNVGLIVQWAELVDDVSTDSEIFNIFRRAK